MKYLLLYLLVASCTIIETIETDSQMMKSVVENDTSYVLIDIHNNAKNVTLELCGIEGFGNIKLIDSLILNYRDVEHVADFKLLPGHIKDTILLNGEIKTNEYSIYEGLIHVPICENLKSGYNQIELELYDGCPWYCEYNGDMIKVLQSINFSVEVEDWENTTVHK